MTQLLALPLQEVALVAKVTLSVIMDVLRGTSVCGLSSPGSTRGVAPRVLQACSGGYLLLDQ